MQGEKSLQKPDPDKRPWQERSRQDKNSQEVKIRQEESARQQGESNKNGAKTWPDMTRVDKKNSQDDKTRLEWHEWNLFVSDWKLE